MKDINTLSTQMENLIAENRALRQMAGVPDNYGIQLDQIKLHDKEKIGDYKKLIQALQKDNLSLEKERATLKNHIKLQSTFVKAQDPKVRYAGKLTDDQMYMVDQWVLDLMDGKVKTDPFQVQQATSGSFSDRFQMEQITKNITDIITQQLSKLNLDTAKGSSSGSGGVDNSKLTSIIQENNYQLRDMLQKLIEQGNRFPASDPGVSRPTQPGAYYMNGGNMDQRYRAPQTGPSHDGEYQGGTSYKFGGSQLSVADKDGRLGVAAASAQENAFLQLQL